MHHLRVMFLSKSPPLAPPRADPEGDPGMMSGDGAGAFPCKIRKAKARNLLAGGMSAENRADPLSLIPQAC
ncbi:hypothetical protein [Paracoccus seriniphilus]|nr:hypothetical protein [Paracoccus seriniphilus]WCR12932.1 hypothetical protein JHW44_08165 [Paracoccus seriniphilus]